MSPLISGNLSATRRAERMLRRERLRTILKGVGVALVIAGIVSAILPFGPSVSNPDVIPKADPQAGLGLIQTLGSATARYVGLGLALVGVVMLLCSGVIARYDSKGDGNGNP
jgi:hypothetical protein